LFVCGLSRVEARADPRMRLCCLVGAVRVSGPCVGSGGYWCTKRGLATSKYKNALTNHYLDTRRLRYHQAAARPQHANDRAILRIDKLFAQLWCVRSRPVQEAKLRSIHLLLRVGRPRHIVWCMDTVVRGTETRNRRRSKVLLCRGRRCIRNLCLVASCMVTVPRMNRRMAVRGGTPP
jgi:hypothetical protein